MLRKRFKIHENHHCLAINKFNEDQNEKILEMEKADFKLGPQTKQAIAYLEACSKVEFLDNNEKNLINNAKIIVKFSKFIDLQRKINRLKKTAEKEKFNRTKIIDVLLAIIKNFQIENINNIEKIEATPPEIQFHLLINGKT